MPPFTLVLAGALAPDVMDKGIALSGLIESYPGRAAFHSIVVEAALFAAAWLLWPERRAAIWALFAGVILHLVQDMPELEVILWPFMGPWEFVPHKSLWEKIVTLYIGKNPFHAWIGEMAGAAYCAGYFAVAMFRRARA